MLWRFISGTHGKSIYPHPEIDYFRLQKLYF